MNLIEIIHQTLTEQKQEPRDYIGASSIGNPCERAIWYGLHHPEAKEIEPKTKLTFEIGKALEDVLIKLINYSSCSLLKSVKLVCNEYDKLSGTPDAIIIKNENDLMPYGLLEIKSAKDSSFNTFKNKGLRIWNPEYYDQIQAYLGMSRLDKCILIAINKDTSDLHQELVGYSGLRYLWLVDKARRIGEATKPPPRINDSPSFYKCKMCGFKNLCHYGKKENNVYKVDF